MKIFKWPGLALMLIPVFFACKEEETGLAFELEDQSIEVKDTIINLDVSSIFIDSLRSDNQSILFGQFVDPDLGFVKAVGYAKYHFDFSKGIPSDTLIYKSVDLVLRPDGTKSLDRFLGEELTIYQALDSIHREVVYLSNRQIPYDSLNPIGRTEIQFNPGVDSVITISLNDNFGASIYNRILKASEDSLVLDSINQGRLLFPPLVFVGGDGNTGLFSIDPDEDTVAIYINLVSADSSKHFHKFTFNNDATHTFITQDRSGATTSVLQTPYEDELTGEQVFLCSINGIYPKINLKPYFDFVEENENFIIQYAELSLGMAYLPNLFYSPPPNTIRFFFIREDGKINGPGQLTNAQRFNSVLLTESSYPRSSNASILSLGYNQEFNNYTTEVTWFTQLLADSKKNDEPVMAEELVVTNTIPTGIRQAVFSSSEIKLRVVYTILNR